MIIQGFDIVDYDWCIKVYYNVCYKDNLYDLSQQLQKLGSDENVYELFSNPNNGYTCTNYSTKETIIVVGYASSSEEMYNTIQHELKHVVEHISEYYNIDPRSEQSAYLQGEIAKNMFIGAAMSICPRHS